MSGIPSAGANPYSFLNTNQQRSDSQEKNLLQEIQEKGFQAYVEDSKKEEQYTRARQKVLGNMNLSEDALKALERKMPVDEYAELLAKIEEMIKQEIEREVQEKAEAARREQHNGVFTALV